jgi:hypothetical protein
MRITRRPWLAVTVLAITCAVGPVATFAQDAATADPHPTMPWNPYHGQVLRYVPVPPQSVTVEVAVPGKEGEEPTMQRQVVQIPGYTVTETTSGYILPPRWTLQQTGPGQYQWRQLPAEFRRK